MSEKSLVSRRVFLGGSLAALAGIAYGKKPGLLKIENFSKPADRCFRFAHMTDIHLTPELNAPAGVTAALKHIHQQKDKPDMIITGGDNVMDLLGATDSWAKTQIDLLKEIFAKECNLPVKFCVGNHECWGWDKKKSGTTGDEPLWGKDRFVKEIGLENRYYAFDQGKWRIILLDSTTIDPKDIYTAKLDDEQFEWLSRELTSNQRKYICLISHIPILTSTVALFSKNKEGKQVVPDEWMHTDAQKIIKLLWENKNVKLCISGHMHLYEKLEYNGVAYVCDGAVSGAWWKGAFQQTQEGYGLFDLYDDGTFDHQYIDYQYNLD